MPAPSYGSVPRALVGPAAGQLGVGGWGGSRECCGPGPGCLARPSGGPGVSAGAFWPEEVTEKWIGASESPRNNSRGQTLLLLRAGQIPAFLQPLPGHGPAPELSATQVATRSSGGPMARPRRCSRRGRTSSGSRPWPPAASVQRAGQRPPSVRPIRGRFLQSNVLEFPEKRGAPLWSMVGLPGAGDGTEPATQACPLPNTLRQWGQERIRADGEESWRFPLKSSRAFPSEFWGFR